MGIMGHLSISAKQAGMLSSIFVHAWQVPFGVSHPNLCSFVAGLIAGCPVNTGISLGLCQA